MTYFDALFLNIYHQDLKWFESITIKVIRMMFQVEVYIALRTSTQKLIKTDCKVSIHV